MSVIHFFTSIASTFRHPTRLFFFLSLFRFIPAIVVEVNQVVAAKGMRKLRCRCPSGSRNKRVSYHWLLWTFNCWCDDMNNCLWKKILSTGCSKVTEEGMPVPWNFGKLSIEDLLEDAASVSRGRWCSSEEIRQG